MPTYTSPGIREIARAGASGNGCVAKGFITGNGAGANVAIADVLRMVRLPAGTEIHDGYIIVGTATGSLTVSVGVEPVDGTTATPAALISAGTAAATTPPVRFNAPTLPYTLTKDSFITITTAGAAILAATSIKLVVNYEYLGNRL